MTTTPPSFFVVGAPKCGTTALCDFLGQHPDIFIPEVKEPNYFGRDLTGARYAGDFQEYLSLFENSGKKISGEGSTWYLYSVSAAEEIYKYNPASRIIAMVREPVELLYSLHNQLVFDGYNENIRSFYEAIAAEKDRVEGRRIPASCLRKEALYYTSVPRFKDQLERYYKFFGKDKVLLILYDDFKLNPGREYARVVEFLGMDASFVPKLKVVNGSKFVKYPVLNSLKRQRKLKRIIKSVFPAHKFELLKSFVQRFNTQYSKRPELNRDFAKSLQASFYEDINYISELLQKDLSDWYKRYENENPESVSGGSTKVRNHGNA